MEPSAAVREHSDWLIQESKALRKTADARMASRKRLLEFRVLLNERLAFIRDCQAGTR
jgi:hypothetical protein